MLQQLGLFPAESPPRFDTPTGIPIYRVTLVRERTAHYGPMQLHQPRRLDIPEVALQLRRVHQIREQDGE